MIKAEKLKEKYEQVKKETKCLNIDKQAYLAGWLDCILYILKEQNND